MPAGDDYRYMLHSPECKTQAKYAHTSHNTTLTGMFPTSSASSLPKRCDSSTRRKRRRTCRQNDLRTSTLAAPINVYNSYDEVKESIDDLLEQANASIDKMVLPNIEKPKQLVQYEKEQEIILRTDNRLRKPQLQFPEVIDNSYNPFVPILTQKYYAVEKLSPEIVRLQEEYRANPEQYRKVNIKDAKKTQPTVSSPYEHELLELKYTPNQLSTIIPEVKYKPLDETPFVYVQTKEQLEDLKTKLNASTEFAVDLEHHSYRTFLGLTSLMQISTRDSDFVIDVIGLRTCMSILAEVLFIRVSRSIAVR